MALNPVGFIDGARVHGETLRRALYASTGGATGITRSGDLAVRAYATPTNAVMVAPGGGIIATTYSDADAGQTYSVSNGAPHRIEVPVNNSSSTDTRHLIVQVMDPQYAGESVPDNPTEATYGQFLLTQTIPTDRPYLHLATITIPPNTGVITQANIRDRRELANPRTSRYLKALAITKTDHLDSTQAFEQWPDQALWAVYVPEWATELRAVCTWQNIASMPGTNISELTVLLGYGRGDNRVLNSTHMVLGYSTSEGSAEQRRQTLGVADTIAVPSGWRGQNITVMGWAKKKEGSVNLIADGWASVSLDLQWVEAPRSEGTWG